MSHVTILATTQTACTARACLRRCRRWARHDWLLHITKPSPYLLKEYATKNNCPKKSYINTKMPLCGGGNKTIQRKIVILGDGACGKTSLLNVFTRGYFPQVYEPTVFENYVHDIFIDGQSVQLSLWDTAGQEEFDRLRALSYSDTHCIMLCFSIDSPDSLENVQLKWVGEIADHCEGVKLVLVALKCDLRNQEEDPLNVQEDESFNPYSNQTAGLPASHKRLIPYEDGLAVAKKVGALRYLECSAKKNRGVNEAFSEAARCALHAKPKGSNDNEPEKKSCVLM